MANGKDKNSIMNDRDDDERIANPGTPPSEPAFDRNANNSRDSRQDDERAMNDRVVTEDRGVTTEEYIAKMRSEFLFSALPAAPIIPGFHLIYLSTTNQYDTIQRRQRMGYVPVRYEEIAAINPEMAAYKPNSGQYDGLVMVNEMLLYKIPQALYEGYMRELHEKMPQEQADRLKSNVEQLVAGAGTGQKLVMEVGDGTNELIKRPAPAANSDW